MTDKRTTWVDGDVLSAADLIDSIIATVSNYRLATENGKFQGVVVHSSTKISAYISDAGSSRISQSTDAGLTFSTSNSDPDDHGIMVVNQSDPLEAFAVEISGTAAETFLTTDSGDTWTTKTDAVFATAVYDASYFSTAMIAIAGDDGGGAKHIVYSTDSGVTWTDPTTAPSAACYAVVMASATVGYAVDSAGNIWKTTDGCDTWTDTTDNFGTPDTDHSLFATDTDTIYSIRGGTSVLVQKYVNSTNTVSTLIDLYDGEEARGIQVIGGVVYFAMGDTTNNHFYLYTSSDESNWKEYVITLPIGVSTTYAYKHSFHLLSAPNCYFGLEQNALRKKLVL
jgi:hypothetical protein